MGEVTVIRPALTDAERLKRENRIKEAMKKLYENMQKNSKASVLEK